jgi:hypothetical protein
VVTSVPPFTGAGTPPSSRTCEPPATAYPTAGEMKWTERMRLAQVPASWAQEAPPSLVRSRPVVPTAQPWLASMKSTWMSLSAPLYWLVQVAPPSVVPRIRPAPAAQPWLAPTNWTAASGGTWNGALVTAQSPDPVVVAAQLPAGWADEDDDAVLLASAVAVPVAAAELAGDTDAAVSVAPACTPDVDVAQPAANAAAAHNVAAAENLEVTGFILITFTRTPPRPARLRRTRHC